MNHGAPGGPCKLLVLRCCNAHRKKHAPRQMDLRAVVSKLLVLRASGATKRSTHRFVIGGPPRFSCQAGKKNQPPARAVAMRSRQGEIGLRSRPNRGANPLSCAKWRAHAPKGGDKTGARRADNGESANPRTKAGMDKDQPSTTHRKTHPHAKPFHAHPQTPPPQPPSATKLTPERRVMPIAQKLSASEGWIPTYQQVKGEQQCKRRRRRVLLFS